MRKLLTILLLVHLLPVGISAQGYYATPEEAKQIVAKVSQANTCSSTLSFSFTQTRRSPMLSGELRSTGKCYIENPGKLRWENETPIRRTFILNGTLIEVRTPDGVSGGDISSSRRYQGLLRQISSSSGELLPEGQFSVRALVSEDGYKLWLTPRRRDLAQIASEFIVETSTDGKIRNIVLNQGEGDYTILSIENATFGAPISEDIFRIESR